MTSRSLSVLAVIVAGAALGGAPAAVAAGRPSVACGETIMQDIRLGDSLVDCPGSGLVIGADGVTVDLGGHTIDGDSVGDDVGIDLQGHRGVTVMNGRVREFREGVLVVGGSETAVRGLTSAEQGHAGILVDGSGQVSITDSVVRDSGAGIVVTRSDSVLVDDNRVAGGDSGGIAVFDSRRVRVSGNTVAGTRDGPGVGLLNGSSDDVVTDNRVSRNAAGVDLDDGASGNLVTGNSLTDNDSGVIVDVGTHANRVLDNQIDRSRFEGIAVVGSDGNVIAGNQVSRNGGLDAAGGIVVIPWPDDPAQTSDANTLVENLAIGNAGDGIFVGGGQSGNLLRGNRADRNSSLGINAALGTIDGGGNLAARNGDSRQCVGVACGQ